MWMDQEEVSKRVTKWRGGAAQGLLWMLQGWMAVSAAAPPPHSSCTGTWAVESFEQGQQYDPCCESKGPELWIRFLIGPILGSYLFRLEAWARGRQPFLHQPGQISGFADTRGGPVNAIIFICTFYKWYFVSSLLAVLISSINWLKCCSCFSLVLYQYSLKSAVP